MNKRAYDVKVEGYPVFRMLMMHGDESAEHVCRAIFGDRFISVS